MRWMLIVVAALSTAACVHAPSEAAVNVIEADIREVQGCESLGEVRGHSNFGGELGRSAGANNARVDAKEEAAAMGATHMVWTASGEGFTGNKAFGRAYRCRQ